MKTPDRDRAILMSAKLSATKPATELIITWEPLPDDFQLEDDPVENTGQPILAGALRESLEISGFIQPQMLIASNFAVCATRSTNRLLPKPLTGFMCLV